MSKDIKKALEHCIEWNCVDCPNREELGSGETVCRGRLLPQVLEYITDLEAKLEEKDKAIENWQTMYESVVQTCHNDKEEIERLQEHKFYADNIIQAYADKCKSYEEQLAGLQQEQIKEMQEHQEAMELADKTIKNLVEDNRASQEWYKKQLAESEEFLVATKWKVQDLNKQLADTETQNKRVLEKLELIVSANQELEQKLAEKEKEILNLKNIVDGIDTLKQYDKDAKQIILINPDNVYADGHRLVVKNADQDKISFALEQLEKVKGYFGELSLYEMYDKIDNQIKQLKEIE